MGPRVDIQGETYKSGQEPQTNAMCIEGACNSIGYKREIQHDATPMRCLIGTSGPAPVLLILSSDRQGEGSRAAD